MRYEESDEWQKQSENHMQHSKVWYVDDPMKQKKLLSKMDYADPWIKVEIETTYSN